MKLLSEAAESGLRAILWMAQRPGELHKVKDIAEAVHAAPGYLVKVLQELARQRILLAKRGNQGGFILQRDPYQLTAWEVLNAIDPIERVHTCPLRLAAHDKQLCPLHRKIDDALAVVEKSFQGVTIAELLLNGKEVESHCDLICGASGTK